MSKELSKQLQINPIAAGRLEKELTALESGAIDTLDLEILFGAGVNDLRSSSKRFAMFVNGKPVDAPTYVNAVMEAYENSLIPQEMDIYMQELRDLERNNPEKFAEWEATKFTPTKFEGGANTDVNKRIKDAGGLSDVSAYDRKVSDYSSSNKLAYSPVPFNGNVTDTFTASILGYHENVERFESESPIKFAVHTSSSDGRDYLIEGRLRVKGGVPIFEDSSGTPYTIESFQKAMSIVDVKGIAAEGDVGHVVAESTQKIIETRRKLEVLKENKNAGPRGQAYIQTLLDNIKKVELEARANDKIFFKTPFPTGSKQLKEAYSLVLQQAKSLGHNEIFIIKETAAGTWDGKKLTVPFGYTSGVTVSEFRKPNQSWKGPRSKILIKNIRELLKGVAVADMTHDMFEEGSSSPLAEALLRTLSRLFDDPQFIKALRKRKTSKKKYVNKINQSRSKVQDLAKLKDRAEKEVKNNKRRLKSQILSMNIKFTRLGRARGGDLLAILNAEIEQEVVNQMVEPSLVNRTGRFASSVKITSAEQRAISYIYRRSPYQVFSMRNGKRPWATKERDPDVIIKAAIDNMVKTRYSHLFRNPIIKGL